MTTRRVAISALAALALLALAACTDINAQPTDPPSTGGTVEPTADPTDEATNTQPVEVDGAAVPQCEDILLEEGGAVDGDVLADCMAAAMIAAGSGSQLLTTTDGTTEVDFEWTPEIALHARGEIEYVIRGDEGWMQLEGRWVRGDSGSSDPEEAFAGTVIELSRAFGDPRGMVMLFTQTSWDIVRHDAVPAAGAVSDTGWLLQPQGPLMLLGVTLSDVELWLGEDHLGLYFEGSGQFSGVNATSSSVFTQWGGPVDIPDPGVG